MTDDELREVCLALVRTPISERVDMMRAFLRFADAATPGRVLALLDERDKAIASVAALFHAYIGLTPGTTVEGLAPDVQAQAEQLLNERLALRAALDAYQVALVETMQRATNGYDWNADPDHITRLQGAASAAAEAACEALFQALAKETPNA